MTKHSKPTSADKSHSSKSASHSTSASTIGALSAKRAKSAASSKPDGGASYESSQAKGRPKLSKQMAKVIGTKGAEKLKSTKEMKERGYVVTEKSVGGQEGLKQATNPKGKHIACKMIDLAMCTARYKVTMERYSLKIMRFIGKKPLVKCFPKVYDIFLVDKVYHIFMSECSGHSLYDLVVGKEDIGAGRIRKWIQSLTEAVRELQKYGIAHRFLKLKHLMLEQGDHLKIVGWSKAVLFWDTKKKKALYQHKERRARKNNFLPPEAFHRLYDPSKADVWAVGVCLISLTTRRYPFHVRAKVKFTTQWRDFVKSHPINPIIRSLANKIFIIDTKKRIHARDMLAHNYFAVKETQLVNKSTRGKPLQSTAYSEKDKSHDVSHSYASHSASKASHSKKSAGGPSHHSKSHKSSKSSKSVASSSSASTSASTASKSKSSKSKSGYGSQSSAAASSAHSRTSKLSKSTVGASAAGSTSKSSKSSKSSVDKSSDHSKKKTQSKVKSSKSKAPKSSSKKVVKSTSKSSKVKSKKSAEVKSSKSTKPKSAVKPKSAKLKSAKPKSAKPKSGGGVASSKAAKSSKVDEGKASEKTSGKAAGKGGSHIDGVSKQEMEAEAADAQADTEQAAEEAAEPVMEEVAKEAGGEADGHDAADVEGVADEQEKAAPEEAKEAGTPAEMEALEGQEQVVEEGAAGEVAEAGVGVEEPAEGGEGEAVAGEVAEGEGNGGAAEGKTDAAGGV